MAEDTPPTAKRPAEENEVIPWSVVFAFASGVDAAHAMATTKSTSRGTLYSDDDVTAGLNLRLEESEVGKRILDQLSSPPDGRFWLPKLMHCADTKLHCHSDGIYVEIHSTGPSDGCLRNLRFYDDTKEVICEHTNAKPHQLRSWFKREKNYFPGVVVYEWIKNGPHVLKVSFSIKTRTPQIDYTGVLRRDGILTLKHHSRINGYRSREKYRFVSWESVDSCDVDSMNDYSSGDDDSSGEDYLNDCARERRS